MRKFKYVFPLLLSVGILLADNPFKGHWKMNHSKSKATRGNVPKSEDMTIADQGDQLTVTIIGTDDTGAPIAVSYTIPVSGGSGQMQSTGQTQQAASYNGVSSKRIDDSTRDTSYMRDGQPMEAEHMVVSSDGNTMTITVKGVDPSGKPVEQTLVFEKQ